MLGPLRWSMPKITKSDAKLSEIYKQNEWHLFSWQCNLWFLSTKVLQGSVATCVNYGRIFIDSFTANLLQSVMVKEFWKSVSTSQSYRQKIKWHLFSGHGVYLQIIHNIQTRQQNLQGHHYLDTFFGWVFMEWINRHWSANVWQLIMNQNYTCAHMHNRIMVLSYYVLPKAADFLRKQFNTMWTTTACYSQTWYWPLLQLHAAEQYSHDQAS